MGSTKEYIKALVHNVKKVLPLKDNLDKIIDSEYEKAFEILDEYIEYIKSKYGIDYKKPKLIISEEDSPFIEGYSEIFNYIKVSKPSIERYTDEQLEFLSSHKKEIEKAMNNQLESLGYKEIEIFTNNKQDIEYLIIPYNSIFFYSFYIIKKNIRKDIRSSIEKSIIDLAKYHEIWHSIDRYILRKLVKNPNDPAINDINNLIITSKDLEVRASAFEVIMYYLASGLYKDKRGYKAVYANILECRNYAKEINKLEENDDKNKYVPYGLGFCYGDIIVAKYGPSLKENIYKIIDDIIHLNKEKAIDEIKNYVYNPDKLLHDKNSNSVI